MQWYYIEKKLPKFNNNGKMIFNWMQWERDNSVPKIHPNQKPIPILKKSHRNIYRCWRCSNRPMRREWNNFISC